MNKFRPHNSEEYQKLMEWVSGATSILEVGSRYGFTLYDLAHSAGTPETVKRVVGIDLPGPDEQWGFTDSESIFRGNVFKLRKEGYDAHAIVWDSHDSTAIHLAKEWGPYDFIFIDACHLYEDVKKDWENYGPLGKTVVFHDIVRHDHGGKARSGVWRLWDELKGEKETFIAKGSPMGIGKINAGFGTRTSLKNNNTLAATA